MPKGTYYETRKGNLKFWRNLPMKFRWRKHCKQVAARKAYMSFYSALGTAAELGVDIDIAKALQHMKTIDGSGWLPTEWLQDQMSDKKFRKLQCKVTTWVPDPNITDEMREQHRQEQAEFELMCGGYPE
jgi:malate synthase